MLDSLRFLQIFPRLKHFLRMLHSQFLHLRDRLPLVDNERLVPFGDEHLQLRLVLLLKFIFLFAVLFIQGHLQAILSFLPHFDDLLESVFGFLPVSFSFVDFAEVAQCPQMLLDIWDAKVGHDDVFVLRCLRFRSRIWRLIQQSLRLTTVIVCLPFP